MESHASLHGEGGKKQRSRIIFLLKHGKIHCFRLLFADKVGGNGVSWMLARQR